MIRQVLINKWFLGGFGILIVFAFGCYLWSQYNIAPYEKQPAETAEETHQSKDENVVQTIKQIDQEDTNDQVENTQVSVDTSEVTNTVSENTNIEDAEEVSSPEETPETESTEEVRVSPFGFGHYPEVPSDYPKILRPLWLLTENVIEKIDEDTLKEDELLVRVLIKLWTEGDTEFVSGSINDGKVFPSYPNTVYLKHNQTIGDESSNIIFGSSYIIMSGPGVTEEQKEQLKMGKKPSGIRILDYDTDSIDPYTFLGL